MESKPQGGGCLCGAVAFEVAAGSLRDGLACHCRQCQRTHGSPAIYSAAPLAAFRLLRSEGLHWYRSSAKARRGFCRVCGASLFWQAEGADYVAIAAGCLDDGHPVRLRGHIFCADKGSYYDISDGLPQFAAGLEGRLPGLTSAT